MKKRKLHFYNTPKADGKDWLCNIPGEDLDTTKNPNDVTCKNCKYLWKLEQRKKEHKGAGDT